MTTIRSLIINVYDSIGYNTQPFRTLALLCYLTGRPGKGIVVTQVINIRVVLSTELQSTVLSPSGLCYHYDCSLTHLFIYSFMSSHYPDSPHYNII